MFKRGLLSNTQVTSARAAPPPVFELGSAYTSLHRTFGLDRTDSFTPINLATAKDSDAYQTSVAVLDVFGKGDALRDGKLTFLEATKTNAGHIIHGEYNPAGEKSEKIFLLVLGPNDEDAAQNGFPSPWLICHGNMEFVEGIKGVRLEMVACTRQVKPELVLSRATTPENRQFYINFGAHMAQGIRANQAIPFPHDLAAAVPIPKR